MGLRQDDHVLVKRGNLDPETEGGKMMEDTRRRPSLSPGMPEASGSREKEQ